MLGLGSCCFLLSVMHSVPGSGYHYPLTVTICSGLSGPGSRVQSTVLQKGLNTVQQITLDTNILEQNKNKTYSVQLIGGWGAESAAASTGKSFRFVRACERARFQADIHLRRLLPLRARAACEINRGYLGGFSG